MDKMINLSVVIFICPVKITTLPYGKCNNENFGAKNLEISWKSFAHSITFDILEPYELVKTVTWWLNNWSLETNFQEYVYSFQILKKRQKDWVIEVAIYTCSESLTFPKIFHRSDWRGISLKVAELDLPQLLAPDLPCAWIVAMFQVSTIPMLIIFYYNQRALPPRTKIR